MLKILLQNAIKFCPINPAVYILKSEPMLWISALILLFVCGEDFFKIPDCNEDLNEYADIEELYALSDQ